MSSYTNSNNIDTLDSLNITTIIDAIKCERKSKKSAISNDVDDYVLLNKVNTFWTDLFATCYLCDNGFNKINEHDDMLFFVTKSFNQQQNNIEVYRRDSKRLPCLTDFNYDWEDTIYLNLILHQFEYTLTCAVCTQTSAKDLQILKKHSKRVYASPSKRDLKSKGTEEVITYPNIYFIIDDFDQAFNEIIVNEDEMVCVELIAFDGKTQRVLFLGSIKYEALKKVYDTRATTSHKIVEKVSLGTYNQKRVEFIKMKGPLGKGYAEMAVSRYSPVNSTLSTPSTPLNDKSTEDMFQLEHSHHNSSSLWKPSWKVSNLRKKTSLSSLNTREIEAKDLQDELKFHNNGFLGRTFGQALTWIKSSNSQNKFESNEEANNNINTNDNNNNAYINKISLNAYLTYVTLTTQSIIQDILESNQQSVLTF